MIRPRLLTLTLSLLFLLGASCHRQVPSLPPEIDYTPTTAELQRRVSPFPPLSSAERAAAWGQEFVIGTALARDLDLYRAITAFKRALILMSESEIERRTEAEYDILESYFLGQKYPETISAFETTSLTKISEEFPAFEDLMIMLYTSYRKMGDEERAGKVMALLEKNHPAVAQKLRLSAAIVVGDVETAEATAEANPGYHDVALALQDFTLQKKSVQRASAYNALLPGMGYWYVGQRTSALTSFFLNALFIWAAVRFFETGNTAAGIITTGFEVGWYVGGIYGAGIAAQQYNEKLFETRAQTLMMNNKLYPVLMLRYSF